MGMMGTINVSFKVTKEHLHGPNRVNLAIILRALSWASLEVRNG